MSRYLSMSIRVQAQNLCGISHTSLYEKAEKSTNIILIILCIINVIGEKQSFSNLRVQFHKIADNVIPQDEY